MERKWTAALASGGRGFTFALDGRLEAGRHWVPQPRPTDRPALFPGIILCRRRSRRARAAVSDFARSAAAITLPHDRWCDVGMESTGVYWKPVYAVLEGHFGLTVGNAHHIKNVPGRKTDVKDAEWIAQLVRHRLVRALLRRLLRAIRANWPKRRSCSCRQPLCVPEVIDWCRRDRVDFIFGAAPTSTLRRHVERLEASTMTRYAAAPQAGRCAVTRSSTMAPPAGAGSGASSPALRPAPMEQTPASSSRVCRPETRVCSMKSVYCRRGDAENHIKAWKTHLAADRTSCPKASANQFRLFLHAGAYWLLWSLRSLMPKRSLWRIAQFDTLRLRLIKIAARVIELKTMIRLHLPTACPHHAILRVVLGRIPRLVT